MTIFGVTTFLSIPNSKICQMCVKSKKWSSNYFLGRMNKSKSEWRTKQSQFWRGSPQDACWHQVPFLIQELGWKDGQALHHASATGQKRSIFTKDFVFPARKVGTQNLSLSEEHLIVSQTLNRSCEIEECNIWQHTISGFSFFIHGVQ